MLCRVAGLVLVLLSVTPCAFPQSSPPIPFVVKSRVFVLDAGTASYVFGINEQNALQHFYWGGHILRDENFLAAHSSNEWASFDLSTTTTPQEYPGWGAGLYVEPSLKVTFPDGNRDLVLGYLAHRIDGETVTVTLKDIERDLLVQLRYTVYRKAGLIRREAVVENRTGKPVVVENAQSGAAYVPVGDGYRLRYLSGRWAGEWQLNQEPVHTGVKVLESRRGSTSHQTNPWFALDRAGNSDPEHGSVWFGALAWSGSWRISVEETPHQQVRVTGGFNSFDFAYSLAPGEKLQTPSFYLGYTDGGIGEASRILHRFERAEILPGGSGERTRPVLYNSWEATEFAVDEPGQIALAEKAASLGVERFVMDDGWFGQRKTDHAGLGDWYVNPEKFPNGLKPLIDKVRGLGMDFGLWVEPEMVNPDSDLYRKHPDWVLNFPGRPRSEQRNQLVLNLARSDVRNYVEGFLDKLLSENDIAFLKWDYNRNWSEPGWDQVPVDQQQRVYIEYIRNLYAILSDLRKKHPNVDIESCSGGGGRVDLGILHYTDEVWPSDNTDPFDRLSMQDGFSYAYPPQIMMAWVTDSPHWLNGRSTSLTYRMVSSMQGSLGIGANLNRWTAEDFATAKRLIAAYHSVQPTIVRGDLYRLISPRDGSEMSATESIARDRNQAVVFAFTHSTQEGRGFPLLQLQGLDPDAEYQLTFIEGKGRAGTPASASGAWWMHHGMWLDLRGDFQAAAFRLDRQH